MAKNKEVKNLISEMTEEIAFEDFGKIKGWAKNWNKEGINNFCVSLLEEKQGAIVRINTEMFYNTFRLDSGSEIVKYPCYNSVLEIRKSLKSLGISDADKRVRTQGNKPFKKVGSILVNLK